MRKWWNIAITILSLLVILVLPGCGGEGAPSTQQENHQSGSPAPPAGSVRRFERVAHNDNREGSEIVPVLEPVDPPLFTVDDRPAQPDNKREDEPVAQPVFRPSDTRLQHDTGRLAKFGIHRYESKRLILYTDIDTKIAKTLPPYVDAAYDALVDYFGPLPPNRERTEYQMTGYIITDKELFRELGLLPIAIPEFVHGRHRGAEFWMSEQEHDYYRRHLMIHEATHCFMMTMPGTRALTWYLEGMAERFGTHRVDENGKIHFGVMPADPREFVGWGRIEMIRREIKAGRFQSLDEMNRLVPNDFLKTPPYAWSWAMCQFFDTHPRYRDRFHKLSHYMSGDHFLEAVRVFYEEDLPSLQTEWALFTHNLELGYDIESTVIDFQPGSPIESIQQPTESSLATDRGWQSSKIRVERGRMYEITAAGKFTLAQNPKPWESEPQGISFLYSQGRPLGMVLAAVESRLATAESGREMMLDVIPVGRKQRFQAPVSGTLYLRVNDFWSRLRDNQGHVTIQVRKLADDESAP